MCNLCSAVAPKGVKEKNHKLLVTCKRNPKRRGDGGQRCGNISQDRIEIKKSHGHIISLLPLDPTGIEFSNYLFHAKRVT